MSYENACDVICVHEDKVNNALSFWKMINLRNYLTF